MHIPSALRQDHRQAIHAPVGFHPLGELVNGVRVGCSPRRFPLFLGPDGDEDVPWWGIRRGRPSARPRRAEALVIVRGPDAYVTPSWYALKAEHGKVVPTWDYVAARAGGTLVVRDDPTWVQRLVTRLTDHHEAGRPSPWSLDDAPVGFIAKRLHAILR